MNVEFVMNMTLGLVKNVEFEMTIMRCGQETRI
jgi:hypothetical protein